MEVSDLELVRAAGGGDDAAFHELMDRHAAPLFRVALSLSYNRADAEDLVQETILGAYRGLKTFAGTCSMKTWLLQILTRQAAKAWHRARHSRQTVSLAACGDESESSSPLAMRAAASVDDRLDVMHMLQRLSPSHREVVVLREIRGLSYEEIAQVLGVPRGTVESRLSRARAELRRLFSSR